MVLFRKVYLILTNKYVYLERLRKEPLDLPGPGDLELVFLGQLVHTQDGNDILKGLVVLQDLLDATGHAVVLGTDDVGVHDSGGGVEGVHGGVDTSLGNRSDRYMVIILNTFQKNIYNLILSLIRYIVTLD